MTNSHNDPPQRRDLTLDDLKLTAQRPSRRSRRSTVTAADLSRNPDVPDVLFEPLGRRRRKKKHPVRTALIIAACCLLSVVVIAVGTVYALQSFGRSAMLPADSTVLTVPEEIQNDPNIDVSDDGKTIVYNGEQYRFNEHRTNILCIGTDKEALGLDNGVVGTGGQADTIVLLSIDTATGATDALAVSRDTMTEIDLYAEDGSFFGVERTQLCLAYAYGDGRESSCDTTVTAVSRLLYGIPINTYFAVDLSTIATLNDAVGGVEVQLLCDFVQNNGTLRKAGEFITLYGDEAERYVRSRDIEELDSNNDRMERQKQYFTAFFQKALWATSENLQVPLHLLNAISDDSVTNLSAAKITYLATSLVKHRSTLSVSQIEGTVTKGEDGYAEYIVDDAALYEQVLSLFYTKV